MNYIEAINIIKPVDLIYENEFEIDITESGNGFSLFGLGKKETKKYYCATRNGKNLKLDNGSIAVWTEEENDFSVDVKIKNQFINNHYIEAVCVQKTRDDLIAIIRNRCKREEIEEPKNFKLIDEANINPSYYRDFILHGIRDYDNIEEIYKSLIDTYFVASTDEESEDANPDENGSINEKYLVLSIQEKVNNGIEISYDEYSKIYDNFCVNKKIPKDSETEFLKTNRVIREKMTLSYLKDYLTEDFNKLISRIHQNENQW